MQHRLERGRSLHVLPGGVENSQCLPRCVGVLISKHTYNRCFQTDHQHLKRLNDFCRDCAISLIMGPSQAMSPYAIPTITISPPTSPREGGYPKRGASTDLATIQETEASTPQYAPESLLSPDYIPSLTLKCNSEQSSSDSEDELAKLKSMAKRLRLSTRRPSYVEWCENLPKWRDLNGNLSKEQCQDDSEEDWRDFRERRERLEEKMQWVRQELIDMKTQDHRLAIQLMRLRSEIQQLRLHKIYHEHRELIDTATDCAHEDRDSSQHQPALCDPPVRNSNGVLLALEKPLKDVGVTKLNLYARRFSLS